MLGHKDHGKSTLIGRLLYETKSITEDRIKEAMAMSEALGRGMEYAFLLDSFEEEREGGFTLDTTRAQVRHGGVIYELIDVPGHRELVRNMLSGASMADAAILIVSAKRDEGLQDETRLHIFIAKLLGIERLVVAVNKMDALEYDADGFARLAAEIGSALRTCGFDTSSISFVPVSAKNGDNLIARSAATPWYGGKTLMEFLEEFSRKDPEDRLRALPARMFVQDVYGGMVVGRLESGSMAVGDEVVFEPQGRTARITGIHVAGRETKEARAGQNVGMTLEPEGTGIRRGDVCMPAGQKAAATGIRARIFCFGPSIRTGDRVRITCASQEGDATVTGINERINPVLDREPGAAGGSGEVMAAEAAAIELEFDAPLVFESFSRMPPTGRFILSKGGRILAAGVVS